MDQEEKYFKQYEQQIALYKFYMDLVVKINAFHYAITGAIVSFYFANRMEPNVHWALTLPILMSLGLVLLFAFGAWSNLVSRKNVFELANLLKLGVAPELMVLTVFLTIFGVANLVVCLGTAYVFVTHSA